MKKNLNFILSLSLPFLFLTGCEKAEEKHGETRESITEAFAEIQPTKGNQVKGKITFTALPNGEGVKVVGELEGLTPEGEHGFHIHEFGDCSKPDASSAGSHFNPTNEPHAGPDDEKRHAGDLGNITADAQGKAHYERIDKVIKLNGPHSILGKSVIVHTAKDDFKTQPTGNAGARAGCGVIRAAK